MTTLSIEGRKVQVSDDFLSLSPADQEKTVEEIASSLRIAPAGQSGSRHPIMSQVNKGIAEAVGGLADFVNPFDEPHALNPFSEGTGSATAGLERLMQGAGVEVAQQDPKGAAQGFARGAGQAAGSLLPVAKGLQALRGAGGAVGRFADDAYRALTTQAAPAAEVFAGGLSGAAEEVADEAGAPEWVQNTAAIAAPMSIPAGAALVKGAARISPAAALTRRAAAELAPYTNSGARAVASDRLQSLAGGRDRAEELAQGITSDNPLSLTPAQQTGDANMLAVERLAADQNPNLRAALETRRADSSGAAQAAVQGMGGDAADAQTFFRQRRQSFKEQLQAQADGAMATSESRLRGIQSQNPDGENGVQITRNIKRALEDAMLQERELWAAIPRDAAVGTGAARAKAEALVAEVAYAQRNDVPRAIRDLLESPEVYGDTATVREMHGLYSELRRVARSAMAGNDQNKNTARMANEVADAILDDLGAKAGTTAIGQQINEARAFSAALHETFDRGAPGRLLKRTLDGDAAIDPELALKRTVGRGGTEAAVSSRQIEAAGGARPVIEDYISGQFKGSAVSGRDGAVTLSGARHYMARNKELLARYPELRSEIEGAVQQRETAEQLSQRITSRMAALEDQKRSAVARFTGETAESAIKSIIDAKNPIQAARRIANEARKDPSGAALDGVKGAIASHLIGSARTTRGAQTMLDATSLNRVLSDPKTARAIGQVFTQAEMSRLRLVARELAKSQATTNATIGNELSGAKANRLIEIVARIGAARHGASLGGGGGASLQTAQMASGRMKDLLNHLAQDKASQMIADAVTDPELFKALLTHGGSAQATERAIPKLLPYLVGGIAAAGQ
ncbi:hypothetical protein PhaeoP30_00753 [Phaeobacter inhibens]|uniref:hypothetical protein n=1 Tax=Phaeobacter inhibens TaxID=221822 RepID=UPI000C9B7CC4|nr:hypothetical protein [Phaeobacter inhibens]AUQ57694.1 hypothetical protein PhaeoP30_00753 [Phaeobacter inhibens]